jgi:hypothetical protein
MQDIAMMVLWSVVVLALFTGLFRFLGMGRNSITGGVVLYLVFGGFVAGAQFAGGGGCPTWRTPSDAWKAVLAWPGDIFVNVVTGDISARRYFIPHTCETRAVTG